MSEDKNKTKKSFKLFKDWDFVKKLKQVKHIGLIVTIIFVLILLLILFGNFDFLNITNSSSNSSMQASTSSYITSVEYVNKLEDKLKTIISKIKGAGNVDVMITLEAGTNMVISTSDNISNIDGTTFVSVSSIASQKSSEYPLVIGEVLPKIKGVVVVSSGANNTAVRLNISNAVQTLFNLNETQIQIFVGV